MNIIIHIGVDFKVKVMDVAGPDGRPKRVKVTIWDTGTPCDNRIQ